MKNLRLPVVHEMLGRVYSDAEWEGLCNGCGNCCYESIEGHSGWIRTGVPCRFLDLFERTCTVYTQRFEVEKGCMRVTPTVVLSGMLPADCSYHDEVRRIVEEDYGGADPRQRRRRKRNGSRKRRRKEALDE